MPIVQIPSGLSIFYRERGDGDRSLLLIHGNLASSRWWERVMAHLPEGVRAVAPDLRGCGDTDKPEGAWTMAQLGEDLYQFARAVGLSRCAVVGHSLGGSVALQLAVDHPELVERLVLINAAPADGLQLPEEQYAQVEAWSQMPDVIKAALGAMMPTAPKDDYYHLLLEDAATKSNGAWLRHGYALRDMNLVEQAARLQVPTLVIWGQSDPLITREQAERTREQIPGAALEVWEGIGHSAPVEAPARLARRLIEFLH